MQLSITISLIYWPVISYKLNIKVVKGDKYLVVNYYNFKHYKKTRFQRSPNNSYQEPSNISQAFATIVCSIELLDVAWRDSAVSFYGDSSSSLADHEANSQCNWVKCEGQKMSGDTWVGTGCPTTDLQITRWMLLEKENLEEEDRKVACEIKDKRST